MAYRILVLALGTFAIGTDNYVVAGILPQVARSFAVSVAVAGQFVTVYSLAYGLLTPVMGAVTAGWVTVVDTAASPVPSPGTADEMILPRH